MYRNWDKVINLGEFKDRRPTPRLFKPIAVGESRPDPSYRGVSVALADVLCLGTFAERNRSSKAPPESDDPTSVGWVRKSIREIPDRFEKQHRVMWRSSHGWYRDGWDDLPGGMQPAADWREIDALLFPAR